MTFPSGACIGSCDFYMKNVIITCMHILNVTPRGLRSSANIIETNIVLSVQLNVPLESSTRCFMKYSEQVSPQTNLLQKIGGNV